MKRDPGEPEATRRRTARLQELRRRVAAGTYRVTAIEVADAILALHRDDQND